MLLDKWRQWVLSNVYLADLGGFGGNTGIQDAQNLAWKLSLVLRNEASPALLATYHTERHPAGVFAMDQAYTTWHSHFSQNEQTAPDRSDFAFDLNVDVGLRYNASAGIAYTSKARGGIYEDPFHPSAQPGSKAPHVWFRRNEKLKSLYDYFEISKFVLVCSGRGTAWLEAKETHFQSLPLKVAIVPLGEFFSKYQIRDTGAVLVRPDGMIGWKALDDSEVGKLGNAMRQLLGYNVEEEKPPEIVRAVTAPQGKVAGKIESENKASVRSGPAGLLRRMATLRLTKRGR